jgi:hypothetical protein
MDIPAGARIYYIRRKKTGQAIACVCVGAADQVGSCFARGISICSRKDSFERKTGRTIAIHRYVQACLLRKCAAEVKNDNHAPTSVQVFAGTPEGYRILLQAPYKIAYDVVLMPFELDLLGVDLLGVLSEV